MDFFLLARNTGVLPPLGWAQSLVAGKLLLAESVSRAKMPFVVGSRGSKDDDKNDDDREQHRVGRLHGVSWACGGDYSRAAIKAPR
jgi:hypothetical protein